MTTSGSNLGSAVLRLEADASGLDKGLASAESNSNARLKSIGNKAKTLGAGFAVAGGVITAALGGAVAAATGFEQKMAQVQAVSGATDAEFKALTEVAKEMGRTTAFTAQQSAEALGFMAMAGMNATDSIEALPQVLNLAAAGQIELGNAADIVTNIMSGYGIEAANVGQATDVLVTGFTSANTSLEDLGTAFTYAGPVANAAGVQFEESAAALALMGNAGIQGSMAGTALRGALTRLLNPTDAVTGALDKLGVETTNSSGELLPLHDIIGQLEGAGLTAGDAMTIFGQRAGPAMLALVSQGSGALVDLTEKMENSGGTAQSVADVQMATFQGGLTELKSALEGTAIAVGSTLIPIITDLVNAVTPIIQKVAEWVEENPKLATTIIAAAAVMGGLALALGGVLIAVGLLIPAITTLGITVIAATGGIVLVIGGLVAAGVALWQNWDWVKKKAGQLWNWLVGAFEKGVNFVIKALNGLTKGWRVAVGKIIDAARKVGEIFGVELPEGVEKFAEALEEGIPEVDLSDMRAEFEDVATEATDTGKAIEDAGEKSVTAVKDAEQDIGVAADGVETSVGDMRVSVEDDLGKMQTAAGETADSYAAMGDEISDTARKVTELMREEEKKRNADRWAAHAENQKRLAAEWAAEQESNAALKAENEKFLADKLAADKEAWAVTEVEYALAQAKIKQMTSAQYAELLAEAEEAGVDDLALLVAQNSKMAAAQLQADKDEKEEQGKQITALAKAQNEADKARLTSLDTQITNVAQKLADATGPEKTALQTRLSELETERTTAYQTTLTNLDTQIGDVKAKLADATGPEKTALQTRLSELETERTTAYQTTLTNLDTHRTAVAGEYGGIASDINAELDAIKTPKIVKIITERSTRTVNNPDAEPGGSEFVAGVSDNPHAWFDHDTIDGIRGGGDSVSMSDSTQDIIKEAQDRVDASGGELSLTETIDQVISENAHTGGYITRGGLVNLAAGEVVMPPDVSGIFRQMAQGPGDMFAYPGAMESVDKMPPIVVNISGDLAKLGDFINAEVLAGNIRGRQEVFYR